MKNTLVLAAASVALLAASAGAQTTINAADRYGYGANVGWLDFYGDGANGAVLGRYYCTGYVYAANIGWIGLGNGPVNGWQYGNVTAGDWGVNHDGAGRLSGYAWGANVGWINFEQTWGRPRVDLRTGILSGYAWGANIGWISLSNAMARVRTNRLDDGPDTDGDGLPDPWERREAGGLTPLGGGTSDGDHDGSSDTAECDADTRPLDDTSFLAVVDLARLSATNRVTWTVQPTRLYRLEQAGVLTNGPVWTDTGLGEMAPGAGATMARAINDPTATSRFYRVKAVVPLAP